MSNVIMFPDTKLREDYVETAIYKALEDGVTLEELGRIGFVIHVVEVSWNAYSAPLAVVIDMEDKDFPFVIVQQSSSLRLNGRYFYYCGCSGDSLKNPFNKQEIEKMIEGCFFNEEWIIENGAYSE